MATGKFEYYKARDGWRWRLKASNGNTIATGGEAYSSKNTCINGIQSVIEHVSSSTEPKGTIITETEG